MDKVLTHAEEIEALQDEVTSLQHVLEAVVQSTLETTYGIREIGEKFPNTYIYAALLSNEGTPDYIRDTLMKHGLHHIHPKALAKIPLTDDLVDTIAENYNDLANNSDRSLSAAYTKALHDLIGRKEFQERHLTTVLERIDPANVTRELAKLMVEKPFVDGTILHSMLEMCYSSELWEAVIASPKCLSESADYIWLRVGRGENERSLSKEFWQQIIASPLTPPDVLEVVCRHPYKLNALAITELLATDKIGYSSKFVLFEHVVTGFLGFGDSQEVIDYYFAEQELSHAEIYDLITAETRGRGMSQFVIQKYLGDAKLMRKLARALDISDDVPDSFLPQLLGLAKA